MNSAALKAAAAAWISGREIKWDHACRWHGSKALRDSQGGWTEVWLQQRLRSYFNKLDRLIFKSACRNRSVRIPRVVVLEHTLDVGWHAHGLVHTPEHITRANLQGLMQRMWLREMETDFDDSLGSELFWNEPAGRGYLRYIFKDTWDLSQSFQSASSSGFVDTTLTYF